MNNLDMEYEKIVERYHIKEGTTLKEIHRMLAKELKKYHPDVNKSQDAEKMTIEINNYNATIKKLIKKYGEDYVYKVKTSTYNGNDNQNKKTSNPQRNTKANTSTNNGNSDYLKKEIENFRFEINDTINKYKYIRDIVKFANDFLVSKVPQIKSFEQLYIYKEVFNKGIVYYRLIFYIYSNKTRFENDEINRISDETLNKINNNLDRDINFLLDVEREYFMKINPLIEKIRKEINKKIQPVINILESIKSYSNIDISSLFIFDKINKLKLIDNVKIVDNAINNCFEEIKKEFIKYLHSNIEKDLLKDYLSNILLEVDSVKNIIDLNNVMKKFNVNVSVHLKKEINNISKDLTNFIMDNSLELLEKNQIERLMERLTKISSISELSYIKSDIEREKVNILKTKFRKQLYDNNINRELQNKYLNKLFNVDSVKSLEILIKDYNEERKLEEQYSEVSEKMIKQTKDELYDFFDSIKDKYQGTLLEIEIEMAITNLKNCHDIKKIQAILENFKRELYNYEKSEFSLTLAKELLGNNKLYPLYRKYINKYNDVTNIDELYALKEKYQKEMNELLNNKDDSHKSKK